MAGSHRVISRTRPWVATLAAAAVALASVSAVAAQERPSVIPGLVPKAELGLAPETEVNVSDATAVPPPSGRTSRPSWRSRSRSSRTSLTSTRHGRRVRDLGLPRRGDDTVSGTPRAHDPGACG